MKRQFYIFLLRWVMNTLGILISLHILGTVSNASLVTFIIAGLIFSLINSLVRPIIIILSLPAILLTLGLFMLIVNGLMVYWAVILTPHIHMTFGNSIIVGIILSLVNYIVSSIIELHGIRKEQEK